MHHRNHSAGRISQAVIGPFFISCLSILIPWPGSSHGVALALAKELDSQACLQPVKLAAIEEPWAMAVLPDGRFLITEKAGTLYLFNEEEQTKTPDSQCCQALR